MYQLGLIQHFCKPIYLNQHVIASVTVKYIPKHVHICHYSPNVLLLYQDILTLMVFNFPIYLGLIFLRFA